MKNLTPTDIYWITLVGIFACGVVIGICATNAYMNFAEACRLRRISRERLRGGRS